MVNQGTMQQQPAFRSGDRIVGGSAARLIQIVYFHQSNPGRVIYTADDRSVVARWKIRDDCRFAWVTWCVAAVYDILDLVLGDNPADDRSLPVIIRGNQRSSAIVQFQYGISHWIRNAILTELRANGAN